MKYEKSGYAILLTLSISLLFFLVAKGDASGGGSANSLTVEDANNINALPAISTVDKKQRGAHIFGIGEATDLRSFQADHLDWITLVSWGFQEDFDSPAVGHHDGDSLTISRHNANWVHRIKQVRAAGFKVFVKPHLWVDNPSDGKWRSDIFPANDEDWASWKNSYTNFILRYAKIAEQAEAEMFCVGVEFSRLSVEKPVFWHQLIEDVRCVYSGKITYAANWYNEFDRITFWDQLDYIGIQAYFPLASQERPSTEQIARGWLEHLPAIEATHWKYDRKIIFTEMGYKSTANSAAKPWEWTDYSADQEKRYCPETQANCFRAFFETVWEKDWFAGVHIWQYRTGFVAGNDEYMVDFTPQGKPAAKVIAAGFAPVSNR